MEIKILQLIEGAKRAEGLTVIIDVFRAFSTACYVMGNNAKEIIPVSSLETAYQLKKDHPDYILLGERQGKIQPGFDFANSPVQVKDLDFTGKTFVQTTTSGTQGIANASQAQEIITGSFVNLQAVVNYINKRNPAVVSLVCMGWEALTPSDEDTFCAEYMKAALECTSLPVFEEMVEKLRNGVGSRFFDPAYQPWFPPIDFDLCLDLNRFDFVLRVAENPEGALTLQKTL